MTEKQKLPKDYIRFTNNAEVFGTGEAEVVVVTHAFDADGEVAVTETDISRFVMAAEIPYTKVGELSRIRLDVICKGVSHSATIADVLAKSFTPRRHRLRDWIRNRRDDTWRQRHWTLGGQP